MYQQQQPMQNGQPAVSKWLWITLIIVIVLGGAFFAWYYLMGPGKASTATTTTTTTTTPAVTDETADWKTYDGSTYTIKYSKNWITDTTKTVSANEIYLLTAERKKKLDAKEIVRVFDISVKTYKNPSDLPNNQEKKLGLDDWIKQEANSYGFTQIKSVTVDSVSGYQGIGSGESANGSYIIFVQKDNIIYKIETGDTSTPTAIEQKIISSFKFTTATATGATSTADWKTYTDSTGIFTIKYPKDWYATAGGLNSGELGIITNYDPSKADGRDLNDSESKITIWSRANASNLSANDFFKTTNPNDTIVSQSKVTVNGIEATKFVVKGVDNYPNSFDVFIPKNDKMYILTSRSNQTNFDSILSTFQFTN